MQTSQILQQAVQYHQAGQLPQAEALYRQILQVEPKNSDAWHLLGVIAIQVKNYEVAIQLIQRAIQINPLVPTFYSNLGQAFYDQGHFAKAVDCFQCALALNPNSVEVQYQLSNALGSEGKLEEAIASYRRTLTLNPHHVDAYLNLGGALAVQNQFSAAIDCFRRVLTWHPNYAEGYRKLGGAYLNKGMFEEAIQYFKKALEINPALREAHSNLLMTLNYTVDYSRTSIFEEHRRFGQELESQILPLPTIAAVSSSSRRLKIGYVSADFYTHVVATFMAPIFAHHDHQQFEIYGYYNNTLVDAVTQWLQQWVDHWLTCANYTDEALADQIRTDQIDILVDLSGHTGENRLPVFARKPAPVQVTYLGYPNTTGLSTIDYRITDHYADPEGLAEPFSSELLVRMPHSYFCYHDRMAIFPVHKSPALTKGYITFGSLNNYKKINPPLLALWAEILHAVPHSKFFIKGGGLVDSSTRQTFLANFLKLGITSDRLVMADFVILMRDHLETYHQIDIALDTFPYNGATTTCEALWMGVPVVTLVGEKHVSRMGLSILSALGLTELIAYTAEEYMTVCLNLANNLGYLQYLRETLRARMQASPLMDGVSFTRHLETAYQNIWKTSSG